MPAGGFPGGIIDAKRLLQSVRGGLEGKVMQCHCTPDDKPAACVGFVLQVGRDSVACRLAVLHGVFDPGQMACTEPLHTLESLLRQHGGIPEEA